MILAMLIALATTTAQHDHSNHHRHEAVDTRGDKVMGFSHEKTKHTFRLLKDGGAVEVRALNADDAESITAIRSHLKEIEKDFTEGTFAKPEEIHGRVPDGAEVMKSLRADITYRWEEIPNGARVRIRTKNKAALEAVHQFLKFEIDDHRTEDAGRVED